MKEEMNEIWIGIQYKNGEWLTVSGEPLNTTGYVRWYNWYGFVQPMYVEVNKIPLCVALVKPFGMKYVDCRFKLPYACEF